MGGAVELISRTEDGLYRLPAFIDAHVHVESSHLTPARFGRLIAAQGTPTAVCDPHEIVNVMGEQGLDFMLADAKGSPADLRLALPSCVPATPFETSGAALSAADTARLFAVHPELIALGEMMNVPGVLADDPEVLGKIAAGMTVFIREGSAAKNLADLLPAVTDDNWERFCFCTDDISGASRPTPATSRSSPSSSVTGRTETSPRRGRRGLAFVMARSPRPSRTTTTICSSWRMTRTTSARPRRISPRLAAASASSWTGRSSPTCRFRSQG